jgi:hypothetical protein
MFHSTKANSIITESNSPSQMSSLVEAVSSPELSNVGVDSHNDMCFFKPSLNNKCDQVNDVGNAVIDSLIRGKVLPQKGKLLDAVINAGPLIENLVLTGPLPNWNNPPPLNSIQIPPFDIKEIDELNLFQNSTLPSSSYSSGSLTHSQC